jgi:hypothetical protein
MQTGDISIHSWVGIPFSQNNPQGEHVHILYERIEYQVGYQSWWPWSSKFNHPILMCDYEDKNFRPIYSIYNHLSQIRLKTIKYPSKAVEFLVVLWERDSTVLWSFWDIHNWRFFEFDLLFLSKNNTWAQWLFDCGNIQIPEHQRVLQSYTAFTVDCITTV